MIKKKLSFLILTFIASLFFLVANSQEKIKINKLNEADLSKMITYSGKLKEAIRFTDKSGDNIVITTETGTYLNNKFNHDNEDGLDAGLYAYHFIVRSNGTIQQTWRVYDYVQDCPLDIEAEFIPNTLQITDLNKNKTAEIWMMYKTACRGDVSPANMKLIMYEGKKKFAMRGQSKVQLSKKEFYGGQYKFDKAFTTGPSVFRKFAKKLWNQNVLETWEE